MNGKIFGTMPDGRQVKIYTLKKGDISCNIITYGGALQSLTVPDKNGKPTDVLLGFDTLEDYINQDKYIGALIGRYANRIGGSSFALDGTEYSLYANDGKNHLHGGEKGFDKQLWVVENSTRDTLVLSLFSPDGQEGYPGNLNVKVSYQLQQNGISIEYTAQSDKDTVCNLTNHAYFNLSGHGSGTIVDHTMQIFADYYTPTDNESIPTGQIASVQDTPMDLRGGVPIGLYADSDFDQLKWAGGYDHNWVINGQAGTLRTAAVTIANDTGIVMKTSTTQCGVQFYCGNYLDGCPNGKNGAEYKKRSGFCLETQSYPDTPNKTDFPSAVLKPGEIYSHKTVYTFETTE